MQQDEPEVLQKYIDHHTILYGESNTGKTKRTAMFLQYLIDSKMDPKTISVLDFAPESRVYERRKIGGKILDYYDISETLGLFIDVKIIPPRLTARNKKEIRKYALQNCKLTEKALKKYCENPTTILLINDISIYLQKGSLKFILKIIKKSTTFYGNSYYGSSIDNKYSKNFSKIESKKISRLIKNIEFSFFTG
ncbi:MAG: hypothetical protein JW891_14150 [Candidatus Lokiarchaeota archaeon]|nr:hypothetical protein [Candidatus Lokiarchaeota archaeon]